MIDSQSFSNWRFLSLCLATHQWCLTGNPCGWCYYSKPDFRHGSRPGIGLEDQKLPRARCPPPNLFGRFISLWCLHNIGCEMESQPEDVKWMWPRVWLSPDAGKRFFFLQLTLLQECELVFCSQNKQAWWWWYILYPTTKGGRLSEAEKMGLLWPLVPACTTHLINYKDSPTNHGPLFLSLLFFFSSQYEFGCGQNNSNGRPK